LKELHIVASGINDAAFAHLTGLKKLQVLDLGAGGSSFSGIGLGYLNQDLSELDFDNCNVSADGMAFVPRFKKLKRLKLSGCKTLTDAMLHVLPDLPELIDLDVGITKLDGSFLEFLPANSKLQRLRLFSMKAIAPKQLPLLARLKELDSLDLPAVELTPDAMAAVASLPKLKTLTIDQNPAFNGEALAGVKGFASLSSLNLFRSPISDAGWQALAAAMPNLQALSLSRYSDDGKPETAVAMGNSLSALRNLTNLSLTNKGISDEWLRAVSQLKNLTILSLQNSKVTDEGLAHLKALPLVNLSLQQTPTTDAAIPILKSFAKLKNLNLNSNEMTDAGREELQRWLQK
jgi:Leucine-rich repeat (LRR) protein